MIPTHKNGSAEHNRTKQTSIVPRKRRSQLCNISANSVNDEAYHRRFRRKHSRPRSDRTVPVKIGTLTTIENAHNTADMKDSVCPVVKIAARPKDGKYSPK